jgi:hypothetical protein
VREFEGDMSPLPAPSFVRPWSAVPKNYIRNVEAVGSNPITSTEGPGQRAEGEIPMKTGSLKRAACLYVSFRH